jgi:hypothetical protein
MIMSAQDARGPNEHEKSATGVARSQQKQSRYAATGNAWKPL